VRETSGLATVDVDDVDITEGVDIPVFVAGRCERDTGSVRRPDWRCVLVIAFSDRHRRIRAVHLHREYVTGSIRYPPDIVQPVLKARESPRRAFPVILFVVRIIGLSARERDAGPVWRPGDLRDILFHLRHLLGLTAIAVDDEQL
jgi:hypothetical protein